MIFPLNSRIFWLCILLFAGLGLSLASAQEPELSARSVVLLDAATGTVLFEKNPDFPIPPASLAKIMTMHVVLSRVESGMLKLTDMVDVPEAAWARRMPPGSSLMFLGAGQRVSIDDLLRGLAVSSGNDAAVCLAIVASGSVQAFVADMNLEARNLGLSSLHFVEPSGIDAGNSVTAREFAAFVRFYIQQHPAALERYHSLTQFSYPRQEHVAAGQSAEAITQYNRNTLLGSIPGVDGLKTGFIEESGYNFALTATRDGMRLIAVTLGGPGRSNAEGIRLRAADGQALLNWGFQNWSTVELRLPPIKPVRVWYGERDEIVLSPQSPLLVSVRKQDVPLLRSTVEQARYVEAPVFGGKSLGKVVYWAGERPVHSIDLVSEQEVRQGWFLKLVWDSIVRFFTELFDTI